MYRWPSTIDAAARCRRKEEARSQATAEHAALGALDEAYRAYVSASAAVEHALATAESAKLEAALSESQAKHGA